MLNKKEIFLGIPKETKENEGRVALTPADIFYIKNNYLYPHHEPTIFITSGAGEQAGYLDEDYIDVGAIVVKNNETLYKRANVVVKVKEPTVHDIPLIQPNTTIISYVHHASLKNEIANGVKNLISKHNVTFCAIELEKDETDSFYPLLKPMSEVAGEVAIEKFANSFVGESSDKKLVVIGLGAAGQSAIETAITHRRFYKRDNIFGIDINSFICTSVSNKFDIKCFDQVDEDFLSDADIIIGAVMVPHGKRAPIVLSKDYFNRKLTKKQLLIDIAIDQGGCFLENEPVTIDQKPLVLPQNENINLISIPNMPTINKTVASQKLSKALRPYVEKIFDRHYKNKLDNIFDIFNVRDDIVVKEHEVGS